MGIIRPATPGFIATLTATILLAIVVLCVPYIKSVYFLKASISVSNINGSITFGTLGYCLELSNGTTCSSPSVGYELGMSRPPLRARTIRLILSFLSRCQQSSWKFTPSRNSHRRRQVDYICPCTAHRCVGPFCRLSGVRITGSRP